MAAITMPMGLAARTACRPVIAPFTALMADPIFGTSVIMVPTADMTLPTTMSTGPMAATTSAILAMTFFVAGSILLSLSTTP